MIYTDSSIERERERGRWWLHIQAHTQCFPSVIKSPGALPQQSPLRIWRPTSSVPAGHQGGCCPWTCSMRLHVFSLGIGSFRKKPAEMMIVDIRAIFAHRLIPVLHQVNTLSYPQALIVCCFWCCSGWLHFANKQEVISDLLMFALFKFYREIYNSNFHKRQGVLY